MGMVIRTLYNNQNWRALCTHPYKDPECRLCFEDILNIRPPSRTDEICTGNCWERHLCAEYRWGCIPKGAVFGRRAYPGMKVFFVFKQADGKYTIWGVSTVRSIDDKPLGQGRDDEVGFVFVHFEPFEPLPRDSWISNLRDIQLVCQRWCMGRHRYINTEQEAYLQNAMAVSRGTDVALNITVMPNIYRRLESIARDEGRQVDEIVREAITKWLKARMSTP